MRRINYIITKENDGQSLEFIFREVMQLSGYLIRRNKKVYDAVSVNGCHADVRTTVHTGDVVSVQISDSEQNSNIVPKKGPLDIVYEDEDIVVLNKRAEDIVHPDHAHIDNTLSNYLKYYFISNNELCDVHPIHRLDNGTSGLVIFAKHSYAQNILTKAMHTGEFERKYLALCHGIIENESGTIEAPIGRQNSEDIKRCVDTNGQAALTKYQVIKRYNNMTLLKATLCTGRTHQIRVHMSHIGNPLVGDVMYGGRLTVNISRPALHSCEAEFVHPITKEKIIIVAPIPQDICNEIGEGKN